MWINSVNKTGGGILCLDKNKQTQLGKLVLPSNSSNMDVGQRPAHQITKICKKAVLSYT